MSAWDDVDPEARQEATAAWLATAGPDDWAEWGNDDETSTP